MNKSKNNGITLIALIITVIVMLILAGVSLNALVGDNGIITQAQKAKIAAEDAAWLEEAQMIAVGAQGNQSNIEYLTDEEIASCRRRRIKNRRIKKGKNG